MRSHFLRLGRQTLIYGFGAVAQQILGVITLPIYARVFSPAGYGVVEDVTVGLAVVAVLIDLGLSAAAQRSYFEYGEADVDRRRLVLSSWVIPSSTLAVILGLAICLASRPLAEWLFGGGRYQSTVLLGGLLVPVLTIATLLREVMRLRFQPGHYLISSLVSGLVGACVSVTLVLAFHTGVSGVFGGLLAGNALAAIYGAAVSLPHVGRRISRRELSVMLGFALPIIPSALAAWVLQFVDRIMLTKLSDLGQVGEYAIANRLALALMLLITAFSIAYAPFMLAMNADDPELERQLRARLLTYVTGAMVTFAVLISLFAREIIAVIAPGFRESYQTVALVCGGTVALGFGQVAMSEITISRRTKRFAVDASIAAALNIGLNVALIPPWGQVGAAVATGAAYLLLALLYYRDSQRIMATPFQWRRLLAISVLGATLMPVGLLGTGHPWELLARLGGVAVLGIGLRACGIVGSSEVAALGHTLARARGSSTTSA